MSCVLDEHAPLKSVVSKFSKRPTPWMTSELSQAIKEKDKAKIGFPSLAWPDPALFLTGRLSLAV